MAQLCSALCWFTNLFLLLLLNSCHHARTMVTPTSTSTITSSSKHSNATDLQALISIKSAIDPRGSLASWNDSIHFCQWLGVTCGGRLHPHRVVALNLSSLDLVGFISPAITNLTFLKKIDISGNQIHGSIPEEIGRLFRLRYLNLTTNSLEGGIPSSLSHCSRLKVLHLKNNKLQGEIPPGLSNCSGLQTLHLKSNNLTGDIPPSLTNLYSLSYLSLSSNELRGGIPPTIGNLTSLTQLFLHHNYLSGSIPLSLANIFSLSVLDLSFNNLTGGTPPTMGNLPSLAVIYLNNNELSGSIPPSFANLTSLSVLILQDNKLSGSIPPLLANLTSLSFLNLRLNELSGSIPPAMGNLVSLAFLFLQHNQLSGSIPSSLGQLPKLKQLYLSFNNITGVIPPSLWNISTLLYLVLQFNYLSGSLPPDIGQALPLLEDFELSFNQFHGPIPASLSNSSHLELIQLPSNNFSGTIPSSLGRLRNLKSLNLQINQMEIGEPEGWSFLAALTNCSRLEVLLLDDNNLSGSLPNSVANLSTKLRYLQMEYNHISGKISPDIGNLVHLTALGMNSNLLTGSVPASIGMLQELNLLRLDSNELSGEIPSTLGNLTLLNSLSLQFNKLSGNIPASLGNCKNLDLLNLAFNRLTGNVPEQVLTISALSIGLHLASNSLTGAIPSEVGSLRNLEIFDVSANNLSGEIPSALGECQVLEVLQLGGNFFQGGIPTSFGSLKGIQKLDVSKNNLSGKIPDFLQDFHGLYYLNLSFNNFEGEVPQLGVFQNASGVSVNGNSQLCGGNPELHLPACLRQSPNKKHLSHTLVMIIGISSSFLLLIVLFSFLVSRRRIKSSRRPRDSTSIREQHERISYAELAKATNGFLADNIIGSGSFGTVYKGILDENSEEVVAVKVLNLQTRGASKSFIAECEAMRNIRHRNLVKIITVCSSADFRGNDFKAVVFEFMSNGSLDDWLHSKGSEQLRPKKLNLMQRLNISIDVASALDYLHHQGRDTPIVHCDLKPTNILLDDDMTAHVGDFGLARFLNKIVSKSYDQCSTSSVGLKGSIGYIAPEYGVANKVSTRGDVYSFGILLLEMFTAKRPTDDAFAGGLSLRKFVEKAFPERITDVVDTHFLTDEDGEASDDAGNKKTGARGIDCIASMLRIGISCSNELPTERMEMRDVIRELHNVRDVFMKKGSPEKERRKAN